MAQAIITWQERVTRAVKLDLSEDVALAVEAGALKHALESAMQDPHPSTGEYPTVHLTDFEGLWGAASDLDEESECHDPDLDGQIVIRVEIDTK